MIAAQKKASLLSSFMSTRWSTLEMDKAITLIRANINQFITLILTQKKDCFYAPNLIVHNRLLHPPPIWTHLLKPSDKPIF